VVVVVVAYRSLETLVALRFAKYDKVMVALETEQTGSRWPAGRPASLGLFVAGCAAMVMVRVTERNTDRAARGKRANEHLARRSLISCVSAVC